MGFKTGCFSTGTATLLQLSHRVPDKGSWTFGHVGFPWFWLFAVYAVVDNETSAAAMSTNVSAFHHLRGHTSVHPCMKYLSQVDFRFPVFKDRIKSTFQTIGITIFLKVVMEFFIQ